MGARDIGLLPHPTTVSRKVEELATGLKAGVVFPQLQECVGKYGGGMTSDMWTEQFTQSSYITVTAHYITNDWQQAERILATREFDPDLRHTGANIKQVLLDICGEYQVDVANIVFVTDRGANMPAAVKDCSHIACCDHVINTVLTNLFAATSLEVMQCGTVRSLLNASKELVRYFKKAGLMRHLPTSLKQEVSTRWNSML